MAKYSVIFQIRCETCTQMLAHHVDGDTITYQHENATDCEVGGETLSFPRVAPDALAALIEKSPKPKAKAASKKTAKK
jgi:hypothetical protein